MGVSKNKGTPKWMVYNGKLIKMDHLGEPLFLETPIYPPQICLFRIMVLDQRPNDDPRRPSLSLWMFGPQWHGPQTSKHGHWCNDKGNQIHKLPVLNQRFRVNLWVFQYHEYKNRVNLLESIHFAISPFRCFFRNGDELVHPGSCFGSFPLSWICNDDGAEGADVAAEVSGQVYGGTQGESGTQGGEVVFLLVGWLVGWLAWLFFFLKFFYAGPSQIELRKWCEI